MLTYGKAVQQRDLEPCILKKTMLRCAARAGCAGLYGALNLERREGDAHMGNRFIREVPDSMRTKLHGSGPLPDQRTGESQHAAGLSAAR